MEWLSSPPGPHSRLKAWAVVIGIGVLIGGCMAVPQILDARQDARHDDELTDVEVGDCFDDTVHGVRIHDTCGQGRWDYRAVAIVDTGAAPSAMAKGERAVFIDGACAMQPEVGARGLVMEGNFIGRGYFADPFGPLICAMRPDQQGIRPVAP